jgi:hypothetical protein
LFFASATCLAGSAGNNFAADPPAKKPATVAEAAKVIDFSKFPLLPGVEEADRRRVASLGYQIESTVAKAFDFQKQQLLKDKWKELPNSFTSEQSASATFSREGFTVSLSVIATPAAPAVRQAAVELLGAAQQWQRGTLRRI